MHINYYRARGNSKMATLHKYFKPVNSSSDLIGPSSLPSSTISQVVKGSQESQRYMHISQEDIGKYASEHGVSKAVKSIIGKRMLKRAV